MPIRQCAIRLHIFSLEKGPKVFSFAPKDHGKVSTEFFDESPAASATADATWGKAATVTAASRQIFFRESNGLPWTGREGGSTASKATNESSAWDHGWRSLTEGPEEEGDETEGPKAAEFVSSKGAYGRRGFTRRDRKLLGVAVGLLVSTALMVLLVLQRRRVRVVPPKELKEGPFVKSIQKQRLKMKEKVENFQSAWRGASTRVRLTFLADHVPPQEEDEEDPAADRLPAAFQHFISAFSQEKEHLTGEAEKAYVYQMRMFTSILQAATQRLKGLQELDQMRATIRLPSSEELLKQKTDCVSLSQCLQMLDEPTLVPPPGPKTQEPVIPRVLALALLHELKMNEMQRLHDCNALLPLVEAQQQLRGEAAAAEVTLPSLPPFSLDHVNRAIKVFSHRLRKPLLLADKLKAYASDWTVPGVLDAVTALQSTRLFIVFAAFDTKQLIRRSWEEGLLADSRGHATLQALALALL
ncbi:hypothetical protein Efla_007726 [Eimeria flavescens]